jgi:hypothetical protein
MLTAPGLFPSMETIIMPGGMLFDSLFTPAVAFQQPSPKQNNFYG